MKLVIGISHLIVDVIWLEVSLALLTVIFILSIHTTGAASSGQLPVLESPTGLCNPSCSCQMDGLYYSEGERWLAADDPCKIYRCSKDGHIDITENGCWFQESCKPVDSTWLEGCNTFTCVDKDNVTSYRLMETGCLLPGGECLSVGQRIVTGCDVMECQIYGGSLNVEKIHSGCLVDGRCMSIGKYWHDGCNVYKCSGSTFPLTLPNASMMWPDGEYAFLKPVTGCPTDVPELWRKELLTLPGALINSSSLSVAENYKMHIELCARSAVSASLGNLTLPEFRTHWQPGSYCILRNNKGCPRGFVSGDLLLAEGGGRSNNISSSTESEFHFCCRQDGNVLSEIVLPIDGMFVLFGNTDTNKCQSVKGMTHSGEYLTFTSTSAVPATRLGDTPSIQRIDGDLTLFLCLYDKINCGTKVLQNVSDVAGCFDDLGQFVPWNESLETDCVKRQCVTEAGENILRVVSEGCRDGGICKPVGTEIVRNCYSHICVLDPGSKTPYFKVTKVGCPWMDTCQAANTTWDYNCITYRCNASNEEGNYQWNVVPVTYACQWNNSCYEEGTSWSDGCIDYRCVVSRQTDLINWSVQTVRLACKGFSGNCVAVGQEVKENCITYKCTAMEDRIGLEIVSVGCDWNGSCMVEGRRWEDSEKCVEYECQKILTSAGSVMQVAVVGYGCMFNNSCKAVNSTWQDGCRTRKCVAMKRDKLIQRSIAPVSAGCDDEGVCRPVGYKKLTDTCMEYECLFNETYKDAFFSLVQGYCRSTNGSCHTLGSRWTEKQLTICVDYDCRKETLGYLSKATEQKCLDSSGVCRKVGSKGFSAIVKGKERQNCECVPSMNRLSAVTFSCKG